MTAWSSSNFIMSLIHKGGDAVSTGLKPSWHWVGGGRAGFSNHPRPVRATPTKRGRLESAATGWSSGAGRQLVAQSQVLQQQVPAGFQPDHDQAEQKSEPTDHAAKDSGKCVGIPAISGGMEYYERQGLVRDAKVRGSTPSALPPLFCRKMQATRGKYYPLLVFESTMHHPQEIQ